MGKSDKIIIMLLSALFFPSLTVFGQENWAVPYDAPVLHELIQIHTAMKKSEKKELEDLTVASGLHQSTKSFAEKTSEAKRLLNERLSQFNSWISLVSSVLVITNQVKDLGESYADFTTVTYHNIKDNPLVIPIYLRTNARITREVSRVTYQVVEYVGYQSNLLKATMAEKMKLLNSIRLHIGTIQGLIWRANLLFASYKALGYSYGDINDIYDSTHDKNLITDIIGIWKRNTAISE